MRSGRCSVVYVVGEGWLSLNVVLKSILVERYEEGRGLDGIEAI